MDYKEIIDKIKPELEKVIGFLERELAKIRTSRVSISLVADLEVDCFGQKLPLKQLGTISNPEARQILIQPWDKSYIEAIEKAISGSNIGAAPIVDKESIRINFPPLSEEFRKNLLHALSEKTEQARKTIRHWRDEAWREVQDKEREGEISEDDKYRGKDELQELVDKHNEKIEELAEKKKKEISD